MEHMTGRLEKEIKERDKMQEKLKSLPPVIGDFYYYLEASDKSYTTIKNYINYVVHFMMYCTNGKKTHNFYKNVTSSTINMYMSSLKFGTNSDGKDIKIGNSIRATRWSALNTFFTFLKSNNLISLNPIEQTFRPSGKKDKQVVYLTEDEIKTCINNVNTSSEGRFRNRDLCIISMGISTGLRVSAITQINIEDIDFTNNTIRVIEKGNKYRTINFGENLREKIIAWINDKDAFYPDIETNALFISRNKNRISVSAVENLLKKYTQNINKNITPHKLRATCATNLYKKTKDIYLVSSQLGHANIATTKIYTEVDNESTLRAAKILDDLV